MRRSGNRIWAALTGIAVMTVLMFQGAPAAAESYASDWSRNDYVEMRLVSAVAGTGELDALRLGLQFRMQPGWKIYWRSPGQAGFPPEADWSQSANLRSAEIGWPAPGRFTIFDMETLGYQNEVILPVTLAPERSGEPVRVVADVNYLTCKELCVPGNGKLVLDIPAGAAGPTPATGLIDRYRAQVPRPAGDYGVAIEQAVLKADGDDVVLRVAVSADPPLTRPDLFVEGPLTAFFDKPEVTLSRDGRHAVAIMRGAGAEPSEMVAQPLRITLVDGDRPMEQMVPGRLVDLFPALPPGFAGASGAPVQSFWLILGLAVLGGLILNLMPCVLPVLSLKFLSVLGHGGRETRDVRIGFLASVAGIMASFLVLAGGLVALKAAGASIGWGIQFQQPVFLAAMVVVVTLFAANLFGIFEIRLPGRLNDLFAFQGGQPNGHHQSLGGHFLAGAFATVLATPCSAPFLGTAVGFALSRGPAEIFMVFAALGLGLSVPYLAIAAFPGLATRLPRPGKWMVTMKRVLALLLVATAIWLLTVVAAGTGVEAAAGIAAMITLMVAVLALRKLDGSRLGRHAGKVAVLLALAAVTTPVFSPAVESSAIRALDDSLWRPFDQAEIRRLVSEGRTVLVDVTADWCITCQVNKAAVLGRDPVAGLIEDQTIVAMRADWTLPNQEIADYLASFGRYGIPFNAVYGPDEPDGVLLPEILVSGRVIAAAEQAAGAGIMARR